MSVYSTFNKFNNSIVLDMFHPNILDTSISICVCENLQDFDIFSTFSVYKVEWTENEQVREVRELFSCEKRFDASKFAKKLVAEMKAK